MLKQKFTDAMGLQDTLLGQSLAYALDQNMPFVQVIHNGRYHWPVLSTYGCQYGVIFAMDMKFNYSLSVQTKRQICALMNCQNKFIRGCGLWFICYCLYTIYIGWKEKSNWCFVFPVKYEEPCLEVSEEW